jgi:hypothetical protein
MSSSFSRPSPLGLAMNFAPRCKSTDAAYIYAR